MFTQHFIINNRPLGTAKRQWRCLGRGYAARPFSEAFCCKWCGEVYARCPVVEDATGQLSEWVFHNRACERCAKPFPSEAELPGSLITDWENAKPFVAALPEQVLQREVLLHINYLEKENGQTTAE